MRSKSTSGRETARRKFKKAGVGKKTSSSSTVGTHRSQSSDKSKKNKRSSHWRTATKEVIEKNLVDEPDKEEENAASETEEEKQT